MSQESKQQHQLIDAAHVYHPAKFSDSEYLLLSIVGSQSSGKSTLLNELFQLKFDVMQSTRKQTTKGVVLDTFATDVKQVIVCDVEGSDGREHGEEQKTERLLLLFALSVSDIMLFNLFENTVGLYHGANMGLMRMVLEIYYEIFIEKHKDDPIRKKTLLFVIRDYTNSTPVEEMRSILYSDIATIWSNLTDKNVDLYFDVNIHALPHFKLENQQFKSSVMQLKHNLIGMSFKDELRVHTDSLNEYMSRIWELITKNKELDVPTQMELVMKYRVERLGQECLQNFKSKLTIAHPDLIQIKDVLLYFFKHDNSFGDSLKSAHASISKYNSFIIKIDDLATAAYSDFQNTTKRISIDLKDIYTSIQMDINKLFIDFLHLGPIFKQIVSVTEESSSISDLFSYTSSCKHYYDLLVPECSISHELFKIFNAHLQQAAKHSHGLLLDQLDFKKDWRSILTESNVNDGFRSKLQTTWALYLENSKESGTIYLYRVLFRETRDPASL